MLMRKKTAALRILHVQVRVYVPVSVVVDDAEDFWEDNVRCLSLAAGMRS